MDKFKKTVDLEHQDIHVDKAHTIPIRIANECRRELPALRKTEVNNSDLEEPKNSSKEHTILDSLLISVVVVVTAAALMFAAPGNHDTTSMKAQSAAKKDKDVLVVKPELEANWSGYIVASDLNFPKPVVTSVSGSWVIQKAVSSQYWGMDQWIGIGGGVDGDSTLIQIGSTSVKDSTKDYEKYYLWYELLPEHGVLLSLANEGDTISANIHLVEGTKNQFSITIADLTAGIGFTGKINYNSQMLSAEWIEERSSSYTFDSSDYHNPNFFSALDFGVAKFGSKYTGASPNIATINSVTSGISSFPRKVATMRMSEAKRYSYVVPLTIASDSSSFIIRYQYEK